MSGRETPALRRAFDAVERPAARRLEAAVQTAQFASGLSLLLAARRLAGSRLEALSRGALHAVNLPAASDVGRVLRELHNLDRSWAREHDLLVRRVGELEAKAAATASPVVESQKSRKTPVKRAPRSVARDSGST